VTLLDIVTSSAQLLGSLKMHRPIRHLAKYIPSVIRRSILHKSMLWLGLPIVGLSGLAIFIGYHNALAKLEIQATEQLKNYLIERGKRESQPFQQAQKNHVYLKSVILEEVKKERKINPDIAFDALVKPWSDGTYRNFDQSKPITQFDTKRNTTVFVGQNVRRSQELKQDLLAFHRIAQVYGPAWNTSFTDLWLITSTNAIVMYWDGIPWALQAPSTLDVTKEEYSYIAHKDKNPDRIARWTGVYFDSAPQRWMVSLVTPVDDDKGNHIASIGHDIMLNDLLDRSQNATLQGTRNLIFTEAGRLIVDRDRTDAIQQANGQLTIEQLNNPKLTHIWEQSKRLTADTSITTSPDQSMLIGITKLAGTDWYFTTLYPKQLIYEQAFRDIIPLLVLSICAVCLEILFIYFILLKQVNQPLQQLLDATGKLSAGEFDVELNNDRIDEVAVLSRSFGQMAQDLQASFTQLNLHNETLESQVADRTQALTTVLNDLKLAQGQLIQSEKMSGLGQMVAGIAHEVNNPVSFIHGNLTPATQYMEDLLAHLHLYRQKADQAALEDHADTIDLEFIEEDLPKVLDSMKVGTDRIREIILGLRNFSRLDEAALKTVNLHEGIDNTLLILNHRFKQSAPEIIIKKNYGSIGPIDCYPSQLNQVVMNLVSNSVDALERYSKNHLDHAIQQQLLYAADVAPWQPTISISTQSIGSGVEISIHDNGPGIPDGIRDRIFNPFFTTKAVGKGTGLGLSISHSIIVEKHHGSIDCESNASDGTTFKIQIPLRQGLENCGELPQLKQALGALN
jgi:two-component system, NtrC family, sensor kinase